MALGEVRMNSDFRVSVDFFAHHKTKKLRRRLGYEGVVALLQLWAYAARVRPDGDLSGMEDEDIELAVDWCGEEGTLVPTLKSVGFLDEDEGGLRLHDWQENNAWAAAGESRSDASRLSRMAKVFPDEYQALVGAGIRGVSKRDYEALRTSNDRWAVIDGMIRGCRRAGGDAQGADNDQTTVVNEARTVVERSLTTVERPFDDDLSPAPAPAPSPAPMAYNNTHPLPLASEGEVGVRMGIRPLDSPAPSSGSRKDGTNPRAARTNPRARGTNPRAGGDASCAGEETGSKAMPGCGQDTTAVAGPVPEGRGRSPCPDGPAKTDAPSKGHPEWRAFLSCWELWPVKQGQEEAWREWMRLHGNGTLAPCYAIREAIARLLAEDSRWARGMVPRMARWLHGKGWHDEPFVQPGQGSGGGIVGVGREPRAPTEFQQRQQDSRKLARALLEAREAERTQTGGHHGHADRQALADHAPCRM